MPKISESRREERRRTILDAALRCFLRSGYQQTSIADIITESGLSAGAIYGYFASKKEIIRGVAARVIGERRSELLAASNTHVLSPAEIARVLIDGARRHAPIQALIQVWSEAMVDDELRAMVTEVISGLRATVAVELTRWAEEQPDRIPAGATPQAWAASTAPVVLALLPGFALQRAILGDFDEDGFVAGLSSVLLD